MAFIALAAVSTVSADQSVIYVNGSSGNDSWDGQSAVYDNTSGSGPKLSISSAIGTVTDNGTVNIADGVYTGENNTNITIDKDLTINGQSSDDTIINGTNSAQIFTINSSVNVTISNLTFANGNVTQNLTLANENITAGALYVILGV